MTSELCMEVISCPTGKNDPELNIYESSWPWEGCGWLGDSVGSGRAMSSKKKKGSEHPHLGQIWKLHWPWCKGLQSRSLLVTSVPMPAEPSLQRVMGLKGWGMAGVYFAPRRGCDRWDAGAGRGGCSRGGFRRCKTSRDLAPLLGTSPFGHLDAAFGEGKRAIVASPKEQSGCRAASGTAPPLDGTRCPQLPKGQQIIPSVLF